MLSEMSKRLLSFLLAMVMVFSMLPVQAFAEDGHEHEPEGDGTAQVINEDPVEDPIVEEPIVEEPIVEEPVEEPEEKPEEGGDDHQHNYVSNVVAPTCTEAGYTEYVCECEDSYIADEVEALGHTYESREVESTETEEAHILYTCTVCGDSYKEAIEPEEPVPEESEALIALRAEIAAYIQKLGITPDMEDVYLLYAYGNHGSYEEALASVTIQDEFWAKGALLSPEEQQILLAEPNTQLGLRYREVVNNAYGISMGGGSQTVAGVLFKAEDKYSSVSNSNGSVIASVQAEKGCNDSWTARTMILYIENTNEETGTVSFNISHENANEIKIDGQNAKGFNNYKKVLKKGEYIEVVITTGANGNDNKVTFSNITFVPATKSATVSVQYSTALGSVTSSVEGTSSGDVDGTTTITIPGITADPGVTLTVTNSSTFLCWVDKDNHLLSEEKTYTVTPDADMTVKAVMTGGNAYYLVNGNLVCSSLEEALYWVENAANKTIVLMSNGTLPAGNYTIPSGVTLLIPYDDANTLCTSEPNKNQATYSIPKVYRKLTMAEGANIIVNGAMSLSAMITGSGANSSPVGNCSFVQMNDGSSITVNDGGNLYAWGYIQGSGSVTVESGGTVYECFQVRDWPGGSNATGLLGNEQRVFIMSQYYIQSIEVPLTLKAGAIENGYMAVYMSNQLIGSPVPFIGPNGMFQINSEYIVKDYDESTGRLLIDSFGNFTVKSLTIGLTVDMSILGKHTYNVNSSEYVLPINGNMTITMHSGAVTMTQDIALLPGAKLIIGEDAVCSLGNGNKIYVYDYDQWTTPEPYETGEGHSFCGTADATHVNLTYPTSAENVQGRTDDAYVEINGTVDTSKGYVYTTAGGANIRGTGTIIMKPGTETETYQFKLVGSENKDTKWVSIPITSAKLQNTDGTCVETASAKGKVIYKSINGVWTCEHGTDYIYAEEPIKAPTCTDKGAKNVTCNCGEVLEVEIASLGHTEEELAAVAATCTTTGLTAGKKCTVCNVVTVEQTTVSALGHKYEAVVTEPTCTAVGYTTHTCSVCGHSYVDSQVAATGHTAGPDATCTDAQVCTVCGEELKAALGHSYNPVVTAPTCTEDGYTTYTCSVCGDSYTDSVVAALGHKEKALEAVAPTCTETGLTEGKQCTVCNVVTVAQTEVAALGHDYKAVVTAPTCTEGGYTTHTCSVCGDSYTDSAVAAQGHTWEWVTDKEATVLVPGIKHEECSVCQEKRSENTEIPVLACAHTDTLTVTEAKAATCTTDGNSLYSYCSACQNYYSDRAGQHEIEKDSWIIPANGCSYVPVVTDPTCTVGGYTTYTCSACGQSYVADRVDKLGHKEKALEAVAPTCTETGLTAGKQCTVCNVVTVAQTEVPALGHKEKVLEAVAPTCTETGLTAGKQCTVCNVVTVAQTEVEAAGHNYEAVVTEPTCTEEGYTTHTCSVCGHSYVDEEKIPALDHKWAAEGETTAATCQAEGKIVYPCENDGCEETKEEILPADPEAHVWDEGTPYMNHSCNSASYMIYTCTLCKVQNQVVVREQHFRVPIAEEIPATCTEDGMTSGWKCEKCNEFWIPQEVIPALGHDWNGNYPCENETSACARCDVSFDSQQEHLEVVDMGKDATCTETGLTEGSHCAYCGKTIVEQIVTDKVEHNWITADEEIPATCATAGHKAGASYCLDCDYDADPIPMLTHSWVHRDAKKATYSAIGYSAHDFCLLCNTVKTLAEYQQHPCEKCGENPEGYVEIPKVEIQSITNVTDFLSNVSYLEMMAAEYAKANPGNDPLGLVLNYIRTGVSNYTSGSWAIMAGAENTDFLKFVQEAEDMVNADPNVDVWVNVSGLKKLATIMNEHGEENIYTGNPVRIFDGHLFGTMDMTYHNKGSQNHADVGGWVGDLTDLLSTTDEFGVPAELTLDEKVQYIRDNYLFKTNVAGSAGSFGSDDLYADLEGYYFMNELIKNGYNTGDLAKLMAEFFQPGQNLKDRVSYLLTNRLDGLSTRKDLRTAVYNAYTGNKLIATLEGTRNFNATGSELAELRKAVCYAFADEMSRLAGDYVEDLNNPRFTVFDSETKILAPGVSQQINYATNADGKQIVYYVATADVLRDDVDLWVNYYSRKPGTPENPQWKNNSVPSSAQNAQDLYGNPENEEYIENFNVIVSTNAGGYDMSDTATPGGLMVMDGVEWHPQSGTAGFFAILSDGSAYMGTNSEYNGMMEAGLIKEAIGGFGEFVVKDGKVVGSATYSDAPRTSVGITATGRVVLMCIDGRQAPFSSGASLQDVGYIMKEAGCVTAINLDGGGSTTFVARQPGSDELTIMNRPSDGYPRNVSTNLLVYSTAPSSTKFDHAVIESEYDYATVGTPVQMTAAGVSPSGNAVDVPEGATWAVSNEDWGSITEDGVFTAKRMGEVTVYVMLDGKTVGSKLMNIANPDQLYFEKNKVDVIYGSGVVLPLKARIGGKPIAINPNDVTFTLSVPNAGSMDGFTFNAVESTYKSMSITAAFSDAINATINVMLYKQGENSFDFDKATGGNRMLAWHRDVSNAKVEDGNIYNVIDPSKDMVTSYTFALDMTTIPIPERLEELTYMLPGGTLEGANAWSFLLSLAQRISDLSWVEATIDFDDRFDVDYNELKILNEYFELKGQTFDETTNTLKVKMHWIKQSQVIDAATANPLCLINGIKVTPKEGVWEDTTKINAVTSGVISYEIYMRASGLVGFAQKPENQAVFGVYPYRNPNDTSDAGGYFKDTYAQITDEYTLVNVLKEGWVNEVGGFAYYVEGERLTGVQKVEGFYYDFGKDGVNVGQTKYTGLFYDETAKVYRYSYIGVLTSGWQSINNEWYYFEPSTMAAATGAKTISHVPYEFEENGRLVSGVWMNVFTGYRYYYGPDYVRKGWYKIGEDMYYFKDAFAVTGVQKVASQEMSTTKLWYSFNEDGTCAGLMTGIVEENSKLYYVENGKPTEKGLFKYGDYHYNAQYDGSLIVNQKYYVWKLDASAELPKGHYEFDAQGRLLGSESGEGGGVSGIINKDGKLYYYENGKPTEKGLFKLNGDYYVAQYDGSLIVNQKYYVWKFDVTGDLPKGTYEFGPDGKMLQGIVNKDGALYYYENGVGVEKGLFKLDGNYYAAKSKGLLAASEKYYAWKVDASSDLPKGTYEFGPDGKMLQGVINKDGAWYYYENGIGVEKGLFLHEDGSHYFAQAGGELITNQTYYAWKLDSSALLPKGNYEFAADGKLVGSCVTGEIVNKNGVLYYYENGKPTEKGLFKFNGDYYVAQYDGKLIVNQKYYVWKHDITSDLTNNHYEFGADGKMLQGIIDKNGVLYYYENGKPTEKGLFKFNGDYYVAQYDGTLIVNQKYYVWKLDVTGDLPKAHYEFGMDGKMLQGVIDKDGTLYYYENGKPTEKGLFVMNGDHYYSQYDGKLIANQKYYAWKLHESSELKKDTYLFDASGKVVGGKKTGEIVNIDGELYYYESGKPVDKGLFIMDGYYYWAQYNGKLVVNQDYYVWKDNEYLMVKTYTFNELGQIVK